MAHRAKHRLAAMIRRAGQGRMIKSDKLADGKPTWTWSAAKTIADAEETAET